MHKVIMHVGAINTLLFHLLRLVGYLTVQTDRPYTNFCLCVILSVLKKTTKHQNVRMTDAIEYVDEVDDDRFICTEESVERNFKTFRSYIETCVKVTDLIVFYDLFTSGKKT